MRSTKKKALAPLFWGFDYCGVTTCFFYNAKNKKKLKKYMNNIEFSFIGKITIDRNKLYRALVLITIQVKKLQSSLSQLQSTNNKTTLRT